MGYRESKYKISSHSDKHCSFNKITIFCLNLYHNDPLHPYFGITKLKFHEIFSFRPLNKLILYTITGNI